MLHNKIFLPLEASGNNTATLKTGEYFILFYLYIYPPDSQESDGGANT